MALTHQPGRPSPGMTTGATGYTLVDLEEFRVNQLGGHLRHRPSQHTPPPPTFPSKPLVAGEGQNGPYGPGAWSEVWTLIVP